MGICSQAGLRPSFRYPSSEAWLCFRLELSGFMYREFSLRPKDVPTPLSGKSMARSNKAGPAIKEHYTDFYSERNPTKVYPVEFVVRTFLGTYPQLKLERALFRGAKILDLGFGDGRNMPLLHDLGFEVYGVEISEEICRLTKHRMNRLGVPG